MPNQNYRFLAREISMFYKENGYINIGEFIDSIEGDEDITQIIRKIQNSNLSENYTTKEIEDYINTIKDYNIKNETKRLKKEMNETTDLEKKTKIAQKIIELKKECNNV